MRVCVFVCLCVCVAYLVFCVYAAGCKTEEHFFVSLQGHEIFSSTKRPDIP